MTSLRGAGLLDLMLQQEREPFAEVILCAFLSFIHHVQHQTIRQRPINPITLTHFGIDYEGLFLLY